uniref:Reverse transcriptase domain-containing protein n=1 Tax=Tanacetum cinerariifolium TaxID=118510 RepID=A0A6L2L0Q3_TANCI|nr:reverse transcriptase domain-containing protein [Tanacetum cinerariifolium]
MEDEFYNLIVKGNNLKTYIRRLHELAILCPHMVPNPKILMEVFIGGLPRIIEGNVTVSKPQTLEEAITITQRLMEQVIKHNSVQETNDHKRKFDDSRNTNNNNYPNDHNNKNHSNNRNNNYQNNHNNNNNNHNNDYHQQQNEKKTFKTYRNCGYNRPHPLCRKYLLGVTTPVCIPVHGVAKRTIFDAMGNLVPPPYIGNFMPPTPDLYFTGLDEFVNKPVVENYKAMSSEEEPKIVRKNDDAPIIEEWVSDNEEEDVS